MVTELTPPSGRPTRRRGNSGDGVQLRRRSDLGRGAWPRITQREGRERSGFLSVVVVASTVCLPCAAARRCYCCCSLQRHSTVAPKTTFKDEYHIWVLTLDPDVDEAPDSLVPRSKASETLDSQRQPFRDPNSLERRKTPAHPSAWKCRACGLLTIK